MGLNVAIVGTSNSILKDGYTFGIKDHPGVSVLDNFSLGASTTVVLPKISEERTFDDYDYVILDFAVNEEQLLGTGATSIADIRDRLINFIARKINSASIVPVVALLPLDWGDHVSKPVSRFYEEFARERGYPFFNGYDYVAELRRRVGKPHTLFRDAAHLMPEVAYGFGTLIAARLVRYVKSADCFGSKIDFAATYHYHKISQSDNVSILSSIKRKSSITEGIFYVITPTKNITVKANEESQLCGLEINSAQTNANCLIDTGQIRAIRSLNNRHFVGDSVKFIHTVVPIEPVKGKAFTICAHSDRHSEPVLEIAGIIYGQQHKNIISPVWKLAEPTISAGEEDRILGTTINRLEKS